MEIEERGTFFKLLAENSPDLTLVLDEAGTIRYASPSLQDMLGYRPEEVIGERSLSFIEEEEKARLSRFLARVRAGPESSNAIDFWARHADGSYRYLECFCAPMPERDTSSLPGVIMHARDITDKRETQEILGKVSLVFLGLGADPLRNMHSLLWRGKEILNTDLSLYCRLQRGGLHVISATHEDSEMELCGDVTGYICHDVIAGVVESPLVLSDLVGTGYENDFFASRHGLRACTAYPVILGGRTVGCMCAYYREAREFTDQELAVMEMGAKAISIEEERSAHEESLKDLTDIVSHELRHPITILRGYASFLQENWPSLDDDKRWEILGIITGSVDRLDNLVNELLDVSRIEKGLFAIYEQEVELIPLVEQALQEMREKGVENEFVTYLPDGFGTIRADPDRLKQLIIILLDNAVKYSPRDSVVEIRAEREDGRLVVSVLDFGPGIRDEDQKHIFERFFQSEEARNHSRSGIGLGLYIAREIAEAHGGRIWYEPREGGGSCFRFTCS